MSDISQIFVHVRHPRIEHKTKYPLNEILFGVEHCALFTESSRSMFAAMMNEEKLTPLVAAVVNS